jgi:photosystem II stability/assembly factor-like uncharacterized protein
MAPRLRTLLSAVVFALLSTLPVSGQQAPSVDALAGLQARTIGPATMSGRIVDLAVVESDVRVFYAASATGGVWKTTNGGVTFTPVFQDQATHSVGDIAVHQRDTSVVWVGTGERASRQSSSWGDGVYKSVDGGESWRNMGLRDSKHIGRIVLHPEDPDVVYVAAMGHLWGPNPERGLYRSSDGGERWERILGVDEDTGAVDVAMDPSDPSILYASTYQRRRRPWGFHGGGPGSALWKSTDGGDSWTRLTNSGLENGLPAGEMGRIGISIYRSDPRIVYVSVEQGERYNASTAYEQRRAGIYRSEDRGESWEHMSDWNPRPMYASQITVDPSDDQRIYMVNTYSWSDDGGRTFTVPRQSLHGDDRLVWVDPSDSRHVMKADDGGLGISWDRGVSWLYATHLPVSQFYRIGLDNSVPFRICGGLQDNGSWCGPSATYRREGILNADWFKVGGGDGFRNVIDTTDNRTLYTESQYLGLSRLDLETGQRVTIRPDAPEGFISARRNWTTWPDLSDPEQELGNAMAPGNWDGPFILSPHDPSTVYAGLDELYVSRDRGLSWRSLGNLTGGTDRRTLEIMGERPDSSTLSLDDGIPYWPTLTEIAESPLEPGVLYVGTDDGQLQVSRDGGASWTSVADRLPGLPENTWIAGLEASRFVPGRIYVTANNYRNDDYGNYVYVSENHGGAWQRLDGGLPANRVARTLREDPRNPDVLYLGTELGLFVSFDRGLGWTRFDAGMPTMAFNDLQIHPRDNDLVLGTHSQGIWIVDNVNALQEMTQEVAASPAHLFTAEDAYEIRYRSERGHTGDMIFRGQNPPSGAILDFWIGENTDPDASSLVILDGGGEPVATVPVEAAAGQVNRAVWNLRMALGTDDEAEDGPQGPPALPGLYTVRLTVGERSWETPLVVRPDPREDIPEAIRFRWTEELLVIQRLEAQAQELADRAEALVEERGEEDAEARELSRLADELHSRLRRLAGGVEERVGPLTEDEENQRDFLGRRVQTLGERISQAGGL